MCPSRWLLFCTPALQIGQWRGSFMEADIHKVGGLMSLFCVLDEGFRVLPEFCASPPSSEIVKLFSFDCFLLFLKLGLTFH